jgi:hypothetical protein
MYDNHVGIAHVVSDILEVYALLVEGATINVTKRSTLDVVNNIATALNVTVRVEKCLWGTVSIINSPTTIQDVSTLSVANNSIIVFNVTVPGNWSLHVISDVYSPIIIWNASTLFVSNNTILLRDTMLGGDGLVGLVHIKGSSVTIDTKSRITVSENTNMTVSNVSPRWQLEFYTLSVVSSPMTIDRSCTLLITNNNMLVENHQLSSTMSSVLSVAVASFTEASTTLEAIGGGLVDISGNTINTEAASSLSMNGGDIVQKVLAIVRVGDGATILGKSIIHHNSVYTSILGSTAAIGTLLNFTTIGNGIDNLTVFDLCSNYVNATPCKLTPLTATTQNTCMLLAVGTAFGGSLQECTSTHTPTPSSMTYTVAHMTRSLSLTLTTKGG